jgi:hypothetical protein
VVKVRPRGGPDTRLQRQLFKGLLREEHQVGLRQPPRTSRPRRVRGRVAHVR